MKQGYVNNWAPEVNSLLKRLATAGFTVVSGHNSEDPVEAPANNSVAAHKAFVEELIACDEFFLYVIHPPANRKLVLYCVLGNSPGELVNDYSRPDLLDKVIIAHSDEWGAKAQPIKPDPYAAARLANSRKAYLESSIDAQIQNDAEGI